MGTMHSMGDPAVQDKDELLCRPIFDSMAVRHLHCSYFTTTVVLWRGQSYQGMISTVSLILFQNLCPVLSAESNKIVIFCSVEKEANLPCPFHVEVLKSFRFQEVLPLIQSF